MASCFFKELQADALNWLSGYLQGCECVWVYVCMCKLTLIDLQDEEVVVSSLYLRSGSFVPDFYKIHTGFLLCTPCRDCWYLQRCSWIALGLESKDLSRQITQLSHFWFWGNTACLDLLTRTLWGHHKRRVIVNYKPKAECECQLSLLLHVAQTLLPSRVLITSTIWGTPAGCP